MCDPLRCLPCRAVPCRAVPRAWPASQVVSVGRPLSERPTPFPDACEASGCEPVDPVFASAYRRHVASGCGFDGTVRSPSWAPSLVPRRACGRRPALRPGVTQRQETGQDETLMSFDKGLR